MNLANILFALTAQDPSLPQVKAYTVLSLTVKKLLKSQSH